MRLPVLHGLIKRRILINFRVDTAVIRRFLPAPFRPKLQNGVAIAGVCLIRLEKIRPQGFPDFLGLSSENAAHRVAVEWDGPDGTPREGVYISRRDTDSVINHIAGGRLFPGEHQRAEFQVFDEMQDIDLAMTSSDGRVAIRVHASATNAWPGGSCFRSLAESSAFFEGGKVGYSACSDPHRLDGVRLEIDRWQAAPLRIDDIEDSFFTERTIFPVNSVEFDHALIMRDLPHRWVQEPALHIGSRAEEGVPLAPAALV